MTPALLSLSLHPRRLPHAPCHLCLFWKEQSGSSGAWPLVWWGKMEAPAGPRLLTGP